MSSFRKMRLVPEAELQRLTEDKQRLTEKRIKDYNPTIRSLAFLQSEIDDVLNNPSLDTEQKLALFQTAQQRFTDIKSKQTVPILTKAAPTQLQEVNEDHIEDDPAEAHVMNENIKRVILNSIPAEHRTRASSVLDHIKHNSDVISVNPKDMTVSIDGEPLEGSNFIDLIQTLYTKRKDYTPQGQASFLTALSSIHVPRSLVKIRAVRDLMSKSPGRSPSLVSSLSPHHSLTSSSQRTRSASKPTRSASRGRTPGRSPKVQKLYN